MAPPSSMMSSVSARNRALMCHFRAPRARRKPISRMRSSTETSMMFMTPTPPIPSVRIPINTSSTCRPIVMQVLLVFIGILTLGIGGVGVMNIMLVSVDERIREIGLRRALGARKWHIKARFLAETLLIMLVGGAIGIVVSYLVAVSVGTLPLMGPLFEDDSGKADIHLRISFLTITIATLVLLFVGVLSAMIPASRAANLDPVEALRYE